MKQVHQRGIADLIAAMAGGLGARAVTEDFLVRIQHRDGELGAFTALDPEVARAAAAESEERYAQGRARALEGVPIAIKANIAIEGLATHAGLRGGGAAAREDAAVVARLRAAGAVVLGQLSMHEGALGATGDNAWHGRAINPHRAGFTPGGSSGGAGAAVAAGLCAAAIGSDTLGSIRIPAAYCGVYGLKPTNGLVDTTRVVPLAVAWDCVGPMARSIEDLAAVIEVIADLGGAPAITVVATLSALDAVALEPAVAQAYALARSLLAGLGVEVRAFDFPVDLSAVRLAGFAAAARELAGAHDAGQFSPALAETLGWAARRSAEALAADRATLDDAASRARAVLGAADAILLPATPRAAFAHGSHVTDHAHLTALANVAGLPALALPAGRNADGLPVGVQLIGRPGSERALIDLARRLDAALGGYAPPPDFA